MRSPLITLSVPVYGTESYLGGLLDSIEAQTVFTGAAGSASAGQHLCSTARQPVPFEVLIVNDASPEGSRRRGLSGSVLQKILKPYKKRFSALGGSVRILEHRKNLGLVEARRTACLHASGTYTVFADSDDSLPPDSLALLIKAALASGADIVHGKAEYKTDFAFHSTEAEAGYTAEKLALMDAKIKNVHPGMLTGIEILEDFLLKGGHSSFLWGKLFRTELLRNAFKDIPHTFCTMAEDLLIYFFILLHAAGVCSCSGGGAEGSDSTGSTDNSGAGSTGGTDCPEVSAGSEDRDGSENSVRKTSGLSGKPDGAGNAGITAGSRYYGTEDIVYTYCLGRGISSNRDITSLAQWERACSAASVFTIIFSHLEEHPLTVPNAEKILVSLKDLCRSHMKMNLNHLQRVSPALQPEAKKILCEYWGDCLFS